VAKKQWSDLSPRTRRFIIAGGTLEAVLKSAALVDLALRPADQVRGSKVRWVVGIVLVNSMGLLPLTYFAYGRRGADRAG
jgi:hypothetical protein